MIFDKFVYRNAQFSIIHSQLSIISGVSAGVKKKRRVNLSGDPQRLFYKFRSTDIDYRGIFLPPADLHWSLYDIPEKLENEEKAEYFWKLQKFLILVRKVNPNVLECLNTLLIEYKNEIADELLAIKDIFFSKMVFKPLKTM